MWLQIVDVWERDWFVFEPAVIEDFKRRLSGETVVVPSAPSPPSAFSPTSSTRTSAAPPPPPPEPESTPSGFRSAGFKPTSFQPSSLRAHLPDAPEQDGDVDGDEVDVDGEEVGADVDGEEVDPPRPPARVVETVVLDDDGDAMDLADSDEDIF